MQLMGGSYADALRVPLEEMARVMDFAKIEQAIEQQKANNAEPKQ